MERIAKLPLVPKASEYTGLAHSIFVDFFLQEVNLRDTDGRAFNPGKGAVNKYEKMLRRMADNIWAEAVRLNLNPVNLSFIFLNRYYPMFIGKTTPVPKMPFFYDEFLIDLSHDTVLFSLLNYQEERRKLICEVIREMNAAKESKKFKEFLKDYVKDFKVHYPEHHYERSRMFEVVLLMLKQMEDLKLSFFLENHAIEVVKAHVWYLKKYGDPVRLTPGCFVGEGAMYRLKNYLTWIKRGTGVHDSDYSFKQVHKNLLELDF